MSLSETCSCGASFTADRDDELKLLNQWRTAHSCKVSGDLSFNTAPSAVTETVQYDTDRELQLGFRYDDSAKR
jgi:hypothetical protein